MTSVAGLLDLLDGCFQQGVTDKGLLKMLTKDMKKQADLTHSMMESTIGYCDLLDERVAILANVNANYDEQISRTRNISM